MNINAKVARLLNPFELVFADEQLSRDELSDQHLLCETMVSAISPGTELAAYSGMPPLRPGKVYPRLVGYCNVARVIACGRGVQSIAEGDYILTGASHRSHYICTAQDIMAVLPAGISQQHAACTYLYHLAYDAILKSTVCYGSPVVIIGLGALGLSTTAVANNAGAEVYALSEHPIPAEKALTAGAKGVFCRRQIDSLFDRLGERLADTVITTTNSWSDWQLALELAGRNGTISALGFPGRGQSQANLNPLDSQYFYDKQLRIQAVGMAPATIDSREFLKFNEADNIQFLLQQINCGRLNPDLLISGHWPWHQLKQAYDALLARENSPITYLLQWQD
ncbi:MAG: zinc-binding alcohol dehydrogenase [Pseudomonadota bacterium]